MPLASVLFLQEIEYHQLKELILQGLSGIIIKKRDVNKY